MLLLGLELRNEFVRDGIEGANGNVDTLHILYMIPNGLISHAVREHRQYFTLQFIRQMRLVFLDELGFKRTCPVLRVLPFLRLAPES